MIDTHCHINDELYENNPLDYIQEAKLAGVSKFVIIGFDLNSSFCAVKIAEQFDDCYAMVGVHPSEIKTINDEDLIKIGNLTNSKKVIGIGEIGLDYYWDKDEEIRKKQIKYFNKQIDLANKLNLPISIHCRDAIEDCLKILKQNPAKKGGIMHCYAGSLESAKEFIKLGFLLGFGGTVTFKNSVKPKEVISNIPSDSYVLETDSPYLTPDPYRGKENHSKYLYLIRNKIAELRNITPEQVEKESTANFERIFSK